GGSEESVPRPWCIVSALPTESTFLRPLNVPNAVLAETGVGPLNAQRSVRRLFDDSPIGGIIHIGFAGSLSPSLHLGDIVVLESIEDEGGMPPVAIGTAARSAATLSDHLRGASGVCITHDRITTTASEKRAFGGRRAEGEITRVDLESAPVATHCIEKRVPYVGFRAISDTDSEDLPLDLNECRTRDGNIDTMRIMWAALHNPSAITGLLELRRRARDCAQ